MIDVQGHSYDPVTCLSMHNSGLLLASGNLKQPSGVVNVWSMHDGSLVYTVIGDGGVYGNGLQWSNADQLIIAFANSKLVHVLNYTVDDYLNCKILARARCALLRKGVHGLKAAPFFITFIKNLPKILQSQYNMEIAFVQAGQQLMHSVYLKSLVSLALLMEVDSVICHPIEPFNMKTQAVILEFQWLENYALAIKMADSLVR